MVLPAGNFPVRGFEPELLDPDVTGRHEPVVLDDLVGHIPESIGDDEHLRLATDPDEVTVVRPLVEHR